MRLFLTWFLLLLSVDIGLAGGVVPCPSMVYVASPPVIISVGPPIRMRPAVDESQRRPPPVVSEPKPLSTQEQISRPQPPQIAPEYAVYLVPGRDPSVSAGPFTLHRVGFWNQTERSVELSIAEKTYTIPPRRSLKLTLPGTFRWHEIGQPSRTESVPPDAVGLEIVIRR